MQPTTIGLDLAKTVFQVQGVDGSGKVVVSRRLRRDAVLTFFADLPPCLVGMEACAAAHFRAREIRKRNPISRRCWCCTGYARRWSGRRPS